ncbi:hypothetical protein IAE35_01805 [Pseudomonas sp. S75]|nr:hypothetical protein [Pseudomonas sp. S30]MBK0152060.1 hypothetical protein [Pseudomonas sp. S75]
MKEFKITAYEAYALILSAAQPRGARLGTIMPATPTQTLYVTVRRDELRQLKDERDRLRAQVAQLNALLVQHSVESETPYKA